MKVLISVLLALALAGCASAPPNLSPQATIAFQNTRVIKGLDLLRDTAISANAEKPPLLSEATTRNVVQYHESALTTIHAIASGWQSTVVAGLDEVLKNLPANERQLLSPYVALTKTVIAEVSR